MTYVALLLQNDNCSTPYKFLGYFTGNTKMKSSCVECKDVVRNLVHLCKAVHDIQHNDNDNYGIFACGLFEQCFDLTLGEETCICNSNLMLDSNNKDLFFLSCFPHPHQNNRIIPSLLLRSNGVEKIWTFYLLKQYGAYLLHEFFRAKSRHS